MKIMIDTHRIDRMIKTCNKENGPCSLCKRNKECKEYVLLTAIKKYAIIEKIIKEE